ncbi:MAG: DUF5060 domain-containing protein [Verrucomicrobiales bacterium]
MKTRKLLILLQAILVCGTSPILGIESVRHSNDQAIPAHRWDVVDIRFNVGEVPEQATDVEFSATFKSGDGKEIRIPGFYNGGAEYLLRFTPGSAGQWRYSTASSHPDLDELQGELSVNAERDGRRGGVVVDGEAPRRFSYENGDSYYPIAFECDWLFALDAENAEDIPVTRKFVDTLAENGFNQVVMNVFASDVPWTKYERLIAEHEFGSPRVFPFGGNNREPDHSRLNVDYFKRLDRVIDYLDHRGIAAHLMIYVWNKRVNWPAADSEEDNRYFDYVVKRYQAFPNLVWDVSKEALGYGRDDVNYISQRIERLRQLDQFDRLITVHDYSYCRRFTENVDFVSV